MIDLNRFCARPYEYSRYSRPVVRSGWEYATDGKILVRVKNSGIDSPYDFLPLEKLMKVLKIMECPADAKPWPEAQGQTFSESCYDCEGTGWAVVEQCSICKGSGEDSCEQCGHSTRCGNCDGLGVLGDITSGDCPTCNGSGSVKLHCNQKLPEGVTVAGRYFKQISELPNVRYAALNNDSVRFFFDGGDGIVMGIRGG